MTTPIAYGYGNLEEFAAACQDLWMGGARGETLSFNRL